MPTALSISARPLDIWKFLEISPPFLMSFALFVSYGNITNIRDRMVVHRNSDKRYPIRVDDAKKLYIPAPVGDERNVTNGRNVANENSKMKKQPANGGKVTFELP